MKTSAKRTNLSTCASCPLRFLDAHVPDELRHPTDRQIAGLAGSFVGGLLSSLIAGDGIELRPSGIIGSLVGAIVVLAIWGAVSKRTPS